MIAFHNLAAPRDAGDGKWVVLAEKDMFLVLLNNKELAYGPDHDVKDYQFDDEIMAHFAAADYYNNDCGRAYPHMDRLLEITDAEPLVFDEEDSQSMEFV